MTVDAAPAGARGSARRATWRNPAQARTAPPTQAPHGAAAARAPASATARTAPAPAAPRAPGAQAARGGAAPCAAPRV
ncbi:MAG: hypothetical protein GC206_16935 [Alphaproteobacteria bacterium]|nr:hypothetical protein [Alphaproteobacteria bacterium]